MLFIDQYVLNQELIDDIECKHNNIKKQYKMYCQSCQKNLCIWCKGHECHQLIQFDQIETSQEEYEKYEKDLSVMESIKDVLKEKFKEIKEKKLYINKLNTIINDVYEKLQKYNQQFESHLKFNKTILSYYVDNKKNYYILKNLKYLDFTTEAEYLKNIKNNDNFKQIDKIVEILNNGNHFTFTSTGNLRNNDNNTKDESIIDIANSLNNLLFEKEQIIIEKENEINKLNEQILLLNSNSNFHNFGNSKENGIPNSEEINMWISEKYCKNWGLREAIREFIQNQYDGVIDKVKTKNNLEVLKIGRKCSINGREKYLEYDLVRKEDNKKFGEIRYD